MDIAELMLALCAAPGPSGHEDAAADVIVREIAPYVDEVKTDVMGSVIAVRRCGKENAPRLMLEAHMDEIGFVVTGYEKGYLRINALGGVDARMLPAREIKVLAKEPVYGVVDVMPPHALSAEDMNKSIGIDKLFVDIGMTEEEARAAVPLGTACVYADGAFRLGEENICGKGLDNRACVAIIIKVMEALAGRELDVDIVCLFSVQEEIGLRGAVTGAFGIAPDYAIVMDVTFGKTPDVPDWKCLKMGGGPAIGLGPKTNRRLTRLITEKAAELDIPYQTEVLPGNSGTDAWAIQTSREGIATALVSLPLKYMHSPVETVRISDAENIVKLVSGFAAGAGEVL